MKMFAVSVVLLLPTLSLAVEVSGDHPAPHRHVDRGINAPSDSPTLRAAAQRSAGRITPGRDDWSPRAELGERLSGCSGVRRRRHRASTGRRGARPNCGQRPRYDLDVHFFDEAVQGHREAQQRYEPWRVVICGDLEFVVTHEFAHAWEAANVDDASAPTTSNIVACQRGTAVSSSGSSAASRTSPSRSSRS